MRQHLTKVPLIPNIFTLYINKPLNTFHYLSIGDSFNKDLNLATGHPKISFEVHFTKSLNSLFKKEINNGTRINDYIINNHFIYFCKKYSGIDIELVIINPVSNKVIFYVNNNYYNLIRFSIDNVHPIGKHLSDLFYIRALRHDMLLLHGASLHNLTRGSSFLIMAPPNTGKTTTTYYLLDKYQQYQFLGEDLSLLFQNNLYCIPFTSTWGHRFNYNYGLLGILRTIPWLNLFIEPRNPNVFDLFDINRVHLKPSPLKRLYILERGKYLNTKKISSKKDIDNLLQKINTLQRLEFFYYKNPLIRSYEYFYPQQIDVDYLFNLEKELLRGMLNRMNQIILIKAPNSTDYVDIINQFERL